MGGVWSSLRGVSSDPFRLCHPWLCFFFPIGEEVRDNALTWIRTNNRSIGHIIITITDTTTDISPCTRMILIIPTESLLASMLFFLRALSVLFLQQLPDTYLHLGGGWKTWMNILVNEVCVLLGFEPSSLDLESSEWTTILSWQVLQHTCLSQRGRNACPVYQDGL